MEIDMPLNKETLNRATSVLLQLMDLVINNQ